MIYLTRPTVYMVPTKPKSSSQIKPCLLGLQIRQSCWKIITLLQSICSLWWVFGRVNSEFNGSLSLTLKVTRIAGWHPSFKALGSELYLLTLWDLRGLWIFASFPTPQSWDLKMTLWPSCTPTLVMDTFTLRLIYNQRGYGFSSLFPLFFHHIWLEEIDNDSPFVHFPSQGLD